MVAVLKFDANPDIFMARSNSFVAGFKDELTMPIYNIEGNQIINGEDLSIAVETKLN